MHSPELVDYIGVESCIDLKPDAVADHIQLPSGGDGIGGVNRSRRLRRRESAAAKEYPPPIPLLARNENLPPHVPWVMKRYYSGDGRLVIVEEKVRRHEYFEAYRSDGRLVMNLVALDEDDDGVEESCGGGEGEEKLDCLENVEVDGGEEINGDGDEGTSDPTAEEALSECYNVGVNTCGGYGAAAVAFRPPVHT